MDDELEMFERFARVEDEVEPLETMHGHDRDQEEPPVRGQPLAIKMRPHHVTMTLPAPPASPSPAFPGIGAPGRPSC